MTHIITRLCLRDTACADVCPVECMVLGHPEETWPWLYIDTDTCIDCGACVPECPYDAIFPDFEVPDAYEAPAGVWITNTAELLPDGEAFEGDVNGNHVKLLNSKRLQGGEILDLTEDIPAHAAFFDEGPGYRALDEQAQLSNEAR